MPNYPSPCESCPRNNTRQCSGKDCQPWLIRYRYRQKKINAYARKLAGDIRPQSGSVWVYPHPDEVRRYLDTDPCDSCMCRNWCDEICPKKAAWWNDRMKIIRKRAGL